MITINAITNDEKNYFKGKIGKEQYSVEASPEAKKFLTDAQASLTDCETYEEVQVILADGDYLIGATIEKRDD